LASPLPLPRGNVAGVEPCSPFEASRRRRRRKNRLVALSGPSLRCSRGRGRGRVGCFVSFDALSVEERGQRKGGEGKKKLNSQRGGGSAPPLLRLQGEAGGKKKGRLFSRTRSIRRRNFAADAPISHDFHTGMES